MPAAEPELTGATAVPPLPRAALVTGAGQRIGRALALALAEAGFAVAVHYHGSRGAAEEVVAAIRRCGRGATALAADLAEEVAARSLLSRAEAARLRDEIRRLEQTDLGLPVEPKGRGAVGVRGPDTPRGRSMAGRAGVSARDVARAKMRARQQQRGRRARR